MPVPIAAVAGKINLLVQYDYCFSEASRLPSLLLQHVGFLFRIGLALPLFRQFQACFALLRLTPQSISSEFDFGEYLFGALIICGFKGVLLAALEQGGQLAGNGMHAAAEDRSFVGI